LIGPLAHERILVRIELEEEAMAEVPSWRLSGDWFDVCRCRVPCGCTFAQAPDEGECNGILAWHIREGNYGDVPLDALNVVGIGSFEGNIWAGEAINSAMGFFIDERGDDLQRGAIQSIWSGEAGGWPAGFAQLIEEVRGIEFAPIDFEIADDLAHWRVEVPGKAKGGAQALTGPTAPEGARVQLHNPPGAEVGPGQIATWATATEDEVEAFGFKWSWPGRSSKHFPFDWSGPDEA
jgi:hypothetical protein